MSEEMTDNQDDWCLISREEKVRRVGLESQAEARAHRADGRDRNESE